jgi:hypothetical protein
MRLIGGSHCFVWGSMAALLYAGAANPDRGVNYLDPEAALDHSNIASDDADMKAGPTSSDVKSASADPVIKTAPAEPEVTVRSRGSDECAMAEDCIDQYLWSMYERTRKVDTIKVQEQKRVAIKKKGHMRAVTKTITKLADEDFTWKDPQAAQRAGMSVVEYVIGGMDRDFKARLYYLFRALDDAGLAPGMTSGFRDDYRQSIASGNKAATDSADQW